MNYVGKLLSNFKGFYNEINSATLTGAIDVVVIQQQDGTYLSSPFHVRFGKMGVLRSREKVVDVTINGQPVDLHLKLGDAGEAFFVQEAVESTEQIPAHLATSPIPSSMELMEQGIKQMKWQYRGENSLSPPSQVGSQEQLPSNDAAPAACEVEPEAVENVVQRLDMASLSPEQVGSVKDSFSQYTQTDETGDDLVESKTDKELELVREKLEEQKHLLDEDNPSQLPVDTDAADPSQLPMDTDAADPSILKSSQISNDDVNSSIPKKDSQTSLVYFSVHTSFEQTEGNGERKQADVWTQTEVTGLDVETKAKFTVGPPNNTEEQLSVVTTADDNGTVQQSAEVTTNPPGPPELTTATSPPTTSINKPKHSISLDSIHKSALKSVPEVETAEKPKVRRKRRRKLSNKKRDAGVKVRHDSSSSATSSLMDIDGGHKDSMDSCSSDVPEEEGLFDMDLSDSEVELAELHLMNMARTVSLPIIENRTLMSEEWANSHFASNFHPFSDGDITPIVSPIGSRPPSPKSDTEYETQKNEVSSQTHLTGDDYQTMDDVKWVWGELPQSNSNFSFKEDQAAQSKDKDDDKKPSGGLFQFMRKTKKMRHQPEKEGIYLDELNLDDMDPEIAALYLYNPKCNAHQLRTIKDEDSESGRGASLPQSPVSLDREPHDIGPYTHKSGDQEFPDFSISLCGGLKESEGDIVHEKFLQYLVTYDEFCDNPNILTDSKLVIRIGDKYYNWQIAGPIVMSALAFQRPLPEHAVESLIKQHMPKKEQRRRGWIWWRTADDTTRTVIKKSSDAAASPPSSAPSSGPNSPHKGKDRNRKKIDGSSSDEDCDILKQLPDSPQVAGEGNSISERSLSIEIGAELDVEEAHHQEKFRKSLKLTSEQIAKLQLEEGPNEVTFSVTTQYQGTSKCTSFIYLWKWDDRIIVSDIDGTITRSDVLGQVLPMIGKDWSQAGIANLYQEIYRNGYKFLYLSARAIGQSRITREYLQSVRQGELSLPDGPVLLSPSSLISAFHKEVIERKPEEFKISCLRDIAALFPNRKVPFYAGFGNKINDVWAYRAVGIPISRIFTVNHRGELKMELTHAFLSSYTKLIDVVDHFFPPLVNKKEYGKASLHKVPSGNFPVPDEYSTFTYWRQPLPDIEINLDELQQLPTSAAVKQAEGSR